MMMMMMMIMTLMKLVNSATKFRHGMDKFYQPNSGLRSSRSLDEAIYTNIMVIMKAEVIMDITGSYHLGIQHNIESYGMK